jgi:hypothetical protein
MPLPSTVSAARPALTGDRLITASERLHAYLVREHWRGNVVRGPDPGIRFNARVGRFLKGYTPLLHWHDEVVYLQAQGYWILDNWLMHDLFQDETYAKIATACARQVLQMQRPAGYWDYPNREWKGRIATVEGCFASLGLLQTYEHVGDEAFLDGAIKWYHFVREEVGFRRQSLPDMIAVNYFSHGSGDGGGVPNNSTMLIWMLAKLARLASDDHYLELCPAIVRWLAHVQLPSGELPYAVSDGRQPDRVHFLCYQYNAFEFVDLVHYYQLTADNQVMPILEKLQRYLSQGLTSDGCGRHSCLHDNPHVLYYTCAIAHALRCATNLGLGDYRDAISLAYQRVLAQQQADGGMRFYSEHNYRVLQDRRSYPRYLAMILHHLLREVELSRESGS